MNWLANGVFLLKLSRPNFFRFKTASPHKKGSPLKTDRRLLLILITIFLDTLGIGLLVPSFPKIIGRFSSDPQVASEYFGFFVGSYALMQFLAAPVLGSLSDKWGRRSILLGSLLGAAVDYLMMAFAPGIGWLLLGRSIAGITGASMTVASSYITDISPIEKRSQNYGLIGAAWGIGFIAGPILGASLDLIDARAPFYLAAGLNFIIFLFTYFVLPESLPPEHRRNVELSKLNPLSSLLRVFQRAEIAILVWTYALLFLAGQAMPVNWPLYTQLKFEWTPMQLGLSLSVFGLVIALSQTTITRVLIAKLGEEKSMILGLFFYSLCFLCFSLSASEWMLYMTIVLFAFTGVATPALQSMMSKDTPPDRQGELHGSLVSIGSMTSVLAPVLYTPLFVQFTKPSSSLYFPGIVFFVASAMTFILFTFWLIKSLRKQKTNVS